MPPHLRLFGGVSLLADGQLVSGSATQPRRIAVLVILAEAWPAAVTRDRIIGLIWPEQDESGARRLLTQALYELRRELGGLVTSGAGRDVSLDASALDVDLIAFRQAVREGDVERAAELHRGPFLDGFHLRDAGEFERWAASVRDAAQRDLRRALDAAIARHEDEGDIHAAARLSERALELSPHDAASVLRAMDRAERASDPGAARRIAGTYERRMREDLELPADELVLQRLARIGREATTPTPVARPARPTVPLAVPDGVPRAASFDGRMPGVWKLAAGIALAGAIIAGVRARFGPTHQPSLLVGMVPFETRGDSSASRTGAALLPVLLANLEGAGGARMDTTSRAEQLPRSLHGVVIASGDQVRIEAELDAREPGGNPARASVTGSRDSILVLAERLSLQLLPALYDNLDATSARPSVLRLGRVSVARHFLDGESALHRAAADSAKAAFRAATALDSADAFLWYRRAQASELAHDIADADRSAALADANRGSLPPRERELVHAYAVWRSGDGRAADSLYRNILQARPTDAEAWFNFAEVSYHGATLFGRPLDEARDAWRRAVALDSSSFPALMHALRLETRAGNDAAIASLLKRAERVHAAEPYLSEAKAIAAASGTRRLDGDDLRRLDALPDASLQFVHAIVASFVERPDVAWEAASRLTAPKRPDAVRADGYAALAQLAMARGQFTAAAAMLDSLDQRDAVEAARLRAYDLLLPFLPVDSVSNASAAGRLAKLGTHAAAAPLYLELSVDASIAKLVRRYHTQLLAARTTGQADRDLRCDEEAAGPERDLCSDLEHGVAAEILRREGRDADALRELESMSLRVPYQLAGRSVYFARTRERFLRAQLLEQAGRLDEAYNWYASVPHTARLDYVYLAPSHLARGRIRERQGKLAAAAGHYRRALELWSMADADPAGIRRDAAAGLQRTANAAR